MTGHQKRAAELHELASIVTTIEARVKALATRDDDAKAVARSAEQLASDLQIAASNVMIDSLSAIRRKGRPALKLRPAAVA